MVSAPLRPVIHLPHVAQEDAAGDAEAAQDLGQVGALPPRHRGLVPVLLALVRASRLNAPPSDHTSTAVTHQVGERQRQHELPRERQHLVVAEARQRPADQDLEAAHQQHLDQEHDQLRHDHRAVAHRERAAAGEGEAGVGHERQVVAAEEQRREQRADDRDLDELGEHEQAHLHRAVLGVVAGDELRLGLRQVERDALVLGDRGGQEQHRGEGLVERCPRPAGSRAPCPTAAARSSSRSTVP